MMSQNFYALTLKMILPLPQLRRNRRRQLRGSVGVDQSFASGEGSSTGSGRRRNITLLQRKAGKWSQSQENDGMDSSKASSKFWSQYSIGCYV